MSAAPFREDEVRRLAEASAWRARLADDEAETSDAFESWIADPANEAAWDQVAAGWSQIGEHAESPELLALRRDALARIHREHQRRWEMPGWRAAIAACFVAILGVGLFLAISAWQSRPLEFATALGERRTVTMVDGSRISLDADSRVLVDYSDESRAIRLVRGQARFDVAHGDARRFLVRAGDRTIVATGTAFNVDLVGERVMVTLIEGSVLVFRGEGHADGQPAIARPADRVALRAGQQLVAAPSAPPIVQAVSLERTTAWESGQLIFEDERLDAIAARMSRYSAHPIAVDPAAGALRVSGVFRAGDTATFIDTVTRYLPLRSAETADGAVVLRPAP